MLLISKTKKYLVRRIAHKRVIRLSIRGFTAPAGSLGKAKKPKVACSIMQILKLKRGNLEETEKTIENQTWHLHDNVPHIICQLWIH